MPADLHNPQHFLEPSTLTLGDAPKGIGALITRRRGCQRLPLHPLAFGGGQERGLRPETLPMPLVAGRDRSPASVPRSRHAPAALRRVQVRPSPRARTARTSDQRRPRTCRTARRQPVHPGSGRRGGDAGHQGPHCHLQRLRLHLSAVRAEPRPCRDGTSGGASPGCPAHVVVPPDASTRLADGGGPTGPDAAACQVTDVRPPARPRSTSLIPSRAPVRNPG